jgi:flagellar biosynthetic protein FliO
MHWWYVCGIAGCTLLAVPVCGAEAEQALQPDFYSAFIRMVSVLVCIVAVILALAAGLRRLNLFRRPILGDKRFIRIIETVYLGPKQSLALVQAGNDFVLLGLSPQQVSFLSKIDVACSPDGRPAGTQGQSFESILAQASTRAQHPNPDAPAGSSQLEGKSFLQKAITRLTRSGDYGSSR